MRILTRMTAVALGLVLLASGAASASALSPVVPPISGPLTQVSEMTVVAVAMPGVSPNGVRGINEPLYTIQATKTVNICGQAQPGMATCQAMQLDTYNINVLASTQVLDRNRAQLNGMFEPGDRINAYGALDSSKTMNAQIVRNLDKPAAAKPPVQLDNLRVVSITPGKDGIQIEAVRGNGSCWNYLGASRLAYPCPTGTVPSPTVRMGALSVAEVYSITVPGTATVLDVNRNPIKYSSISVNDMINVYGVFVAPGILQASLVRDLTPISVKKLSIAVADGSAQLRQGSKATIKLVAQGGTQPYSWSTAGLPDGMQLESQGIIACITAPCPQPSTIEATIKGAPAVSGNFNARVTVVDAAGVSSYLDIPLTVSPSTALEVSVKTNRKSYRVDDTMRVSVTVSNPSRKTETVQFSSSCQADYDVLPGFSLRSLQLCALSLTSITLKPGTSKTYTFEHRIGDHAMPKVALPFDFEVVGRVVGVGEARTTVTISPTR